MVYLMILAMIVYSVLLACFLLFIALAYQRPEIFLLAIPIGFASGIGFVKWGDRWLT